MTGMQWRKHTESKGWANAGLNLATEDTELLLHFKDGSTTKASEHCLVSFDEDPINGIQSHGLQ